MKVRVLGHACLYIEHLDVRLLIDPWLIGSCYWRSWWNYPEVPADLLEQIRPTHIYITHLHWDHYHGPSLRRFLADDPVILLPKSPTIRMVKDMRRDFRFSRIRELSHGKKYPLGPDFAIYSYQFNPVFIDSSLVVESANACLFNANDSKVFGLSLRQIIQRHPQFDLVFRSHSSASADPYCVDGVDPWATSRSPRDYALDFLAFAEASGAKFAIPFASSHVYLHKDTETFNQYYNSPQKVMDEFSKLSSPHFRCVQMPPGSSWSDDAGFSLVEHDYSQINHHIQALQTKHHSTLAKHYQREKSVSLNEASFTRYFTGFSRAIHFPLKQLRFAFFASASIHGDMPGTLAIVDTKKRQTLFLYDVTYSPALIDEQKLDFILRVNPLVLNDCTKKSMFNTFAASKLLRIQPNANSKRYLSFFSLADLYENDGLPLWRCLEPRQLINRLRRLREPLDVAWFVYKTKLRRASLSTLWGTVE
jgi:UDP-MurNAc hydroxylase